MKRAVLVVALAMGCLVSGAIAQTPSSDDKEVIPPRSIQLTAEQSYIIKEIVLSDAHVAQVPRSPEINIGEKAPANIELHAFPELVAAKVPQVKTYKFFVVEASDRGCKSAKHCCGHNQVNYVLTFEAQVQ